MPVSAFVIAVIALLIVPASDVAVGLLVHRQSDDLLRDPAHDHVHQGIAGIFDLPLDASDYHAVQTGAECFLHSKDFDEWAVTPARLSKRSVSS